MYPDLRKTFKINQTGVFMKKIISLCLLIVTVTATATATTATATFDGPYAGVNATLINYREKFMDSNTSYNTHNTHSILPPTGANASTSIKAVNTKHSMKNHTYAKTASGFGLFAGYGKEFEGKIWTALDAHYTIDSLYKLQTHTEKSGKGSSLLRSNGTLSAAMHLGHVENNRYIAYFILGGNMRSFVLKNHSTFNNNSYCFTKHYKRFFISPGVGARFALNDRFSFKCEYLHNIGKHKTQLNVFNAGLLVRL